MYEDYLKTIYWLAELYEPIFHLSNSEWDEFASFLLVDAECLKERINSEMRIGEIERANFNCAPLFNVLLKTYICIENIKKINDIENNTDNSSIRQVYLSLYNTVTLISSLNAELAAFMCMKEDSFTTKYAVQDWESVNYQDDIWFLTNYMDDDPFSLNKETLQLSIKLIKYDIETRLNTIYCTGVLLLIDNSPFFKDDIKGISRDMYLYLISRLKNCRLIGMILNIGGPHVDINARGRIDNTTQMLMVYGYDNYDTYSLRLDLPHKGIRLLHYNNRSPGRGNDEVKCCIFSRDEYNETIKKYSGGSGLKELFIEYSDIFALKERSNCNFSSIEEERLFDLLESSHEHVGFSEVKYDEKSLLEFIELFSFFYRSQREIIQSDDYAIKCFNYDRIMFQSKLLLQSIIHCELTGTDYRIDEQINSIVRTAIRYGIVEQYDGPYDIEDIKIIIECTEDRIRPILR